MTTRKPGLVDHLTQMATKIAESMEPLLDAFYGVEIRRSEHVGRGKAVRVNEPRRAIVMHPLDAIALEFPNDPVTQLIECQVWILDRAERELDRVLARIDRDIDFYTDRQQRKLLIWLFENKMTLEQLEAAGARS